MKDRKILSNSNFEEVKSSPSKGIKLEGSARNCEQL